MSEQKFIQSMAELMDTEAAIDMDTVLAEVEE